MHCLRAPARSALRDHLHHPRLGAEGRWNTTAGDVGPHRAMLWTLSNALACARYHNLLHRNCDLVTIANHSNLTNSLCSGIPQTDNHRLYMTPTYLAQYLYANLAGSRPLRIESELPTDLAPDLSATLSEDGATLTLFAVNDTCEPIARTLDLGDLLPAVSSRPEPRAQVEILADSDAAGEPVATNSFERPDRVALARSDLALKSARFDYTFPALSLTVLQLRADGRR